MATIFEFPQSFALVVCYVYTSTMIYIKEAVMYTDLLCATVRKILYISCHPLISIFIYLFSFIFIFIFLFLAEECTQTHARAPWRQLASSAVANNMHAAMRFQLGCPDWTSPRSLIVYSLVRDGSSRAMAKGLGPHMCRLPSASIKMIVLNKELKEEEQQYISSKTKENREKRKEKMKMKILLDQTPGVKEI